MLRSLATTSLLCWLTNARFVRKLHGSIYLSFIWLRLITDYKWLLTKLNLYQKSCFSSFNHHHSVKILPFPWQKLPWQPQMHSQPSCKTEMCTCVHISVTQWYIVGYLSNALRDLGDGSIMLQGIIILHNSKILWSLSVLWLLKLTWSWQDAIVNKLLAWSSFTLVPECTRKIDMWAMPNMTHKTPITEYTIYLYISSLVNTPRNAVPFIWNGDMAYHLHLSFVYHTPHCAVSMLNTCCAYDAS